MRDISNRATIPTSELVVEGLLRLRTELYSTPIRPRMRSISGDGGFGTEARASSTTGSLPENVMTCGYSRPPTRRCSCFSWSFCSTISGATRAKSPTCTASVEDLISQTADDAATETTSSDAMALDDDGGAGFESS